MFDIVTFICYFWDFANLSLNPNQNANLNLNLSLATFKCFEEGGWGLKKKRPLAVLRDKSGNGRCPLRWQMKNMNTVPT